MVELLKQGNPAVLCWLSPYLRTLTFVLWLERGSEDGGELQSQSMKSTPGGNCRDIQALGIPTGAKDQGWE